MRKTTNKSGARQLVPQKREKHPNAGRRKGSKNAITRIWKEAILLAAEKNGDGLVGYFRNIARTRPDLMLRLLGRAMLLQEKELAKTKKEPRPIF
jgi:hypothetical protein